MFYFGVVRLKEVSIQKPKHTDNSKPNKYSYLNEIHSKHKLKSAKTDITEIDEEYLIEERGRKHKKKKYAPLQARPRKFILNSVVSDVKQQLTVYANTNCTKTDIDELYELLDVEDSIYSRSESFSSFTIFMKKEKKKHCVQKNLL